MRRALFGLVVLLCCNGSSCFGSSSSPGLEFEMYAGGDQGDARFDAAWTAAFERPELGVDYTFPLLSENIDEGAIVRLYAGRPTGFVTGADVIVEDQHLLATTHVRGDGTAEFAPFAVATGNWTGDSFQIPAELLCGETVIVARAFADGPAGGSPGSFIAATWFTAVAQPCP